MTKNSLTLVYIVPAILLLLVTFINFPYGFYTFLRLVVSISSGFIIYLNYKEEKKNYSKYNYLHDYMFII